MRSNRLFSLCFAVFIPLAGCAAAAGDPSESTGSSASADLTRPPQNCNVWAMCGDAVGVYCDAQAGVQLGLYDGFFYVGYTPLATNAPLSTSSNTYLYSPALTGGDGDLRVCILDASGVGTNTCAQLPAIPLNPAACPPPSGSGGGGGGGGGKACGGKRCLE